MPSKIPLAISLTGIANLLGVVSLVGSLIFVGAELRQNQKLARVNAYQTRLTEMQESQRALALSGNVALADLISKYQTEGVEALSNAEFLRVRSWYRGTQIRMESQFYQWEQGFLEDNAIEVTLNVISETAYAAWEDLDLIKNINPPAWKEIIQSRMQGVPAS